MEIEWLQAQNFEAVLVVIVTLPGEVRFASFARMHKTEFKNQIWKDIPKFGRDKENIDRTTS